MQRVCYDTRLRHFCTVGQLYWDRHGERCSLDGLKVLKEFPDDAIEEAWAFLKTESSRKAEVDDMPLFNQ